MVNAEEMSSDQPRNINAEWVMLKELARSESLGAVAETDEAKREQYLQQGRKVLEIMNTLPDKMDEVTKIEKIDEIYRAADEAGVKETLDKAIASKYEFISLDRVGRETFGRDRALTAEEEQKVEELRQKVIDLTEIAPGALAEEFPSGNYLFHSAKTDRLEGVFRSGELKNGLALKEDDPQFSALGMNSGFEGISWSMDQIDAMPGTRGHMAGFLAAPETILQHTNLVVPSRPAPFEVLQISNQIDPQKFYATKNQLDTWGRGEASLNEKNNVDGNLMRMLAYEEGNFFFGQSLVYDYGGSLAPEKLRKYYTLNEDNSLTWDDDIYQKSEVPPALPWMQSLIDRGIFARNDLEELDSVEKVVERARSDENFTGSLIATAREATAPIKKQYDEMLDDATAIRIGVDEMYFVTSHHDLEDWLQVMARTGAEPKGILLYDDEQVILENFASKYEGNHRELSREIGRAVDVDSNFWKHEMGMDPENLPRSGAKGQVLLESAVKRDKIVRLDENGQLEIVEAAEAAQAER